MATHCFHPLRFLGWLVLLITVSGGVSLAQPTPAPHRAAVRTAVPTPDGVTTPRIDLVHSLVGETELIELSGNRAYVGQGGTLKIFNVQNPDQPVWLASIPIANDLTTNTSVKLRKLQVEGDQAYVFYTLTDTDNLVLAIIDVSIPSYPQVRSRYTLGYVTSQYEQGHQIHHIQVYGAVVYYEILVGTNPHVHELRILDMHDPANPTLRTPYQLPTGGQVIRFPQGDNLAYITLSDPETTKRKLQLIDVSTPDSPQVRGNTLLSSEAAGGAYQVFVINGLAYVLSETIIPNIDSPTWFEIIDVRNPDAPTLLTSYTGFSTTLPQQEADSYRLWHVQNGYAYIGKNYYVSPFYCCDYTLASVTLLILDIRNPAAPTVVGSYVAGDKPIEHMQVVGNMVYLNTEEGLQIIDVTDPTRPTRRSTFTPGGVTMQVADGRYYGARDGGLIIVDVQNPDSPTLRGSYTSESITGTVHNAYVTGNRAYASASSWRAIYHGSEALRTLYILDTTDPAHPTHLGSVNLGTCAYCSLPPLYIAAVVDGWVYISERQNDFFSIIDARDPVNPLLLQAVAVPDPPTAATSASAWNAPNGRAWGDETRLYVRGTYAFLVMPNDSSAGLSTIHIFDVSNPPTQSLLGTFTTPAVAGDLDMSGTLVYIPVGEAGLQIVDLSDPANPVLRGSLDTPGTAYTVQLVGNLAYLADGSGGVQVIDVSDPANPVLHASVATPGEAQHIQIVDPFVYVGAGAEGLQILDLRDLTNPVLVANYPYLAVTEGFQANGDMIAIGPFILRFARPQVVTVPPEGVTFTATESGTTVTFPTNTFAAPVTVTYTPLTLTQPPTRRKVIALDHTFAVTAVVSDTQEPAQPAQPFTLTVPYQAYEPGSVIETTLALYWWDGSQWVKEPGSSVDPATNTLTAITDHFGRWTVMGETRELFLPIVGY